MTPPKGSLHLQCQHNFAAVNDWHLSNFKRTALQSYWKVFETAAEMKTNRNRMFKRKKHLLSFLKFCNKCMSHTSAKERGICVYFVSEMRKSMIYDAYTDVGLFVCIYS